MKKKVLVSCLILSISFLAVEITLHLIGYKPYNPLSSYQFTDVDRLEVYKSFKTDSDGIFKFNYHWFKTAIDRTKDSNTPESFQSYDPITKFILLSYSKSILKDDSVIDCILPIAEQLKYRGSINYKKESNIDTCNELEEAIKEYNLYPINKDGFRSIAFKRYNCKRKSVLLLGDSYTFGLLAFPLTTSFYDYLLNCGYVVYNAGIPGTDVPQYKEIAKKYVPILKPDFVIVLFDLCGRNDIMEFDRKPSLKQPLLYYTNAGMLNGYSDNGELFKDAKDSYMSSLNKSKGLISKHFPHLIYKSIVVSRLIHGIDNLLNSSNIQTKSKDPIQLTHERLMDIDSICKLNNSELIVSLIPDTNGNIKFNNSTMSIFRDLSHFTPTTLSAEDYPKKFFSTHFTSSGHIKYGIFLSRKLDSLSYISRISKSQ